MQTSVYAAGDEEDDCVEESVYESVDVVERVLTSTSTLPGPYRWAEGKDCVAGDRQDYAGRGRSHGRGLTA